MAGSFRIAEGYVEISADESAYDRAMQRLRAKHHAVSVTVQLDDTAALARLRAFARERATTVTADITANLVESSVARVTKALDKLTRDRMVRILATADTRVAADEIRNLTQRRRVRIGIDVDTRVAADDIANLTRRRMMTVEARANTTEARERLAALTRDRRVNVQVDVDRSALSMLSSIGGGGGGGLGLLSSSVARLAAVAVGALPTVASLAQSIAAMGPAAAVAAPAVLSLGTAFAAVKVGTSGVSDAFKAAFAPAVTSGAAAEKATRRVEDAQRSLARAQQGVKDAEQRAAEARAQAARRVEDAQRSLKSTVQDVADANRRAAQQVAQAERDLADAQRAARQAQLDLTAARKDAARQLEDLANQQEDVELDRREAVLRVQDAQEELNKTLADPKATERQRQEAQLTYDQAVQHLEEIQLQQQRLAQDAAAANRAGVEGSKQVTDAKQRVADANQAAADQTRALRDAELEQTRTAQEGAQKVAAAERAVADARAAATKAAVDGARGIADAQAQVADAARALADAQTSGAAATNKVADAMARLAPNARAFVNAVLAQAGAWRALKLDVQNRLFAGLGQTFTTMSTAVLPSLRTGLVGTAGVLNTMAKNAAGAVTQLAKTGTLRQMFAGLNEGLKPLTRIPGQFVTGLAQISIAASPAFQRLTTAAAGAADRISQKLTAAFKSGRLEEAINHGVEIAKQFGKLLADIFGTVGNVMKAAAAGGGDALGSLGVVFKELRKVTAMPEVQKALTSIFSAINSLAKLLAGTLGQALRAVLPALAELAPPVQRLVESLGKALGPIIKALSPILVEVARAAGHVLDAFRPFLPVLSKLIVTALKPLQPMIAKVGEVFTKLAESGVIEKLANTLGDMLGPVLEGLGEIGVQVVKQFADRLIKMLPDLLEAGKQLAPVFVELGKSVGEILKKAAPLLPQLMLLSMAMISELLPAVLPLLKPLADVAIALIKIGTKAITGIVLPALTKLIEFIQGVREKMRPLVAAAKWVTEHVAAAFQWLYDKLVGHSIIPDLVRAITRWFTSLLGNTKRIFTTLRNWVVDTWNKLWNAARSKWDSFWNGLRGAMSRAWTSVRNSVSGLRTSVTNTWSSMWNSARDKVSSIFSSIRGKINDFRTWMKSAFANLRDGLGSIWRGIQGKLSGPVKWVVGHVYNDGIRRMWNTIAGKISSKISLPVIRLGFNQGGVVPGKRSNRDTVPAMLAPGERVLSNQQVDRLGGHRGIDALLGQGQPAKARRASRDQPVPAFADGGIAGTITGAIGSGLSWAKDLVVGGLKEAARKAIASLIRPLIDRIPGGGFGNLMRGLANKALAGILGWLGSEDKKAGQVSYNPSAGVAQWKPQILQALSMLGQSAGWLGTVQRRMNQESGGNPRAVNLWDINAKLGHPSVGLMQVIGPTFRSYAGRFRGTGPFMYGTSVAPLPNIYAGLNYALHRYGSLSALNRPGGYDEGGLLADGATMVVNSTRKPERILTPQQNALFEELVRGGGGGITIEAIHVNGTFDFSKPSSQRQAARQLVVAMKEELRNYDRRRA